MPEDEQKAADVREGGVVDMQRQIAAKVRPSKLWLPVLLLAHLCAQAQSDPDWTGHNRYIEVGAGIYRQHYREQDLYAVTADGILNSETGNQDLIRAALRWQSLQGWLVELSVQRQNGATDYSGYLQSGGQLTPYIARTGNVAHQASVGLGYGLNAGNWHGFPANWQLIPIVKFSRYHWQRNLVQYSETYGFNALAAGAIAQWQMRPGTVLKAQVLAGHTSSAQVSAETLGFKANQVGGHWQQWQLAVTQDMGVALGNDSFKDWRLVARYVESRFSHGASSIVAGLQAPPNKHVTSALMLGVQRQF